MHVAIAVVEASHCLGKKGTSRSCSVPSAEHDRSLSIRGTLRLQNERVEGLMSRSPEKIKGKKTDS